MLLRGLQQGLADAFALCIRLHREQAQVQSVGLLAKFNEAKQQVALLV